MKTLTNLEVHWLAEELGELEGCFFEKMQDIEGGYKLRFTSHELVALLPERVHLTRYSYDASEPSNLSMYARKHLRGSKVAKVAQEGFDRVLVIGLDNGFTLVFELFAKGNLILVKDGKTMHCLRRESWRDREIRPGKEYRFPRTQKLNPLKMTKTEFGKVFDQSDVIRSLVKHLNMSGKYLEEACHRAGVDKSLAKPGKEEKARLFEEIRGLIREHKPGVQGEPVATKLSMSDHGFAEKESLNQALDDYHSPDKPVAKPGLSKLEKRLKKQEQSLAELREKAVTSKQKGDLIYARLNELQELFRRMKELKKQGKSWEEIGEELGVDIDAKTRKLKISG